MQIPFVKYSGTGNDFILIDDRSRVFPEDDEALIQAMCNRHFGIGSDGLMLLRNQSDCDFEMIFFNPDATKSLCGNGSRCAVHFAKKLGVASDSGVFLTTDGLHDYQFIGTTQVQVSMRNVDKVKEVKGLNFVNTGSPHLIVPVQNLESIDILNEGRKWRLDESFAKSAGTNVNFVREIDSNTIRVRTYERGVESETLSCGTGVTAVALASKKNDFGSHRIAVYTEGGKLNVSFVRNENGFSAITLQGPVLEIFEGVYHAGE